MNPHIAAAAQRIQEIFHPTRILLVGSWARGTATDDSDIDLVVLFDHAVDWRLVGKIRGALRGLPSSFDIFATSEADWQARQRAASSFERVLSEGAVDLALAA